MTTSRAGTIAVALVDDHQLVRQSIGSWLTTSGADVEVVASVATVAELSDVVTGPVDVVLLDLTLADGSRPEENIAALVTAGSRVVVVSADAEPASVRRAIAAGALSYVPKSAAVE